MLKPSEAIKKQIPSISLELQMGLWWLGIGIFCGFVFGFTIGVIFS